MALDAFGRLRTSDCFTTFNYYPSAMTSNTTLDIDVWVPGETGGAQSYNSQNYINMPISGSGVTIRFTISPTLETLMVPTFPSLSIVPYSETDTSVPSTSIVISVA